MSGKNRKKPNIIVSEIDYERLMTLAEGASEKYEEIAEELMLELERAKVVTAKRMPENIVHMGSNVEYRSHDGTERRVTLVYPGEADIAQGKISILTPIGTALIGLAPGQSMSWVARDGRKHELNVINVTKAGSEDAEIVTNNVVDFTKKTAAPVSSDENDPGPSAA